MNTARGMSVRGFDNYATSVKLKHLFCVLMEQHISEQFLLTCIAEAERRETEGLNFKYGSKTREKTGKRLARKF